MKFANLVVVVALVGSMGLVADEKAKAHTEAPAGKTEIQSALPKEFEPTLKKKVDACVKARGAQASSK